MKEKWGGWTWAHVGKIIRCWFVGHQPHHYPGQIRCRECGRQLWRT